MLTSPRPRQRGIALLTVMVLLAMLTMIAVTGARLAVLEERMAGNARDRDLALRAAEMGLRDAERELMNAAPGATRAISGCSGFVADCGQSTPAATDDGLCYKHDGYAAPVWQTTDMSAAPSVPYGGITQATAIAGVYAQPRYLIECLPKPDGYHYRITVRAQGSKPGTTVMLEEIFTPGER